MQKAGIMSKKQAPKRAQPVADDATNQSACKPRPGKPKPGKPKPDKPQVPPQSQPLNEATRKRKSRLDHSNMGNRKQAIDVTGDDSDDLVMGSNSTIAKAPKQAPRKADKSGNTQQTTIQPRPPDFNSASSTPRYRLNRNNVLGTSTQQESPPDRPAKRARCEDATDTDRDVAMRGVEQYHIAPPEDPATAQRKIAAAGGFGPQPKFNTSGLPSNNLPNGHPCYELGAIPSESAITKAPTSKKTTQSLKLTHQLPNRTYPPPDATRQPLNSTHQPSRSAERAAFTHSNFNYAEIVAKSNQNRKLANTPSQPKSTSPIMTLTEKINLTREFSTIFAITEIDAYQLLMANDWVEDKAVVAHLSTATVTNEQKTDGTGAENGKEDGEGDGENGAGN
jgi:hypothetical protein